MRVKWETEWAHESEMGSRKGTWACSEFENGMCTYVR